MRYFTTEAQRAQRKEFYQEIFRTLCTLCLRGKYLLFSFCCALPRWVSAVTVFVARTDERQIIPREFK